MRTGVITVTEAGQMAPVGYLEQALTNNPTAMGLAVYDGEKLWIERVENPDMDMLKRTGEAMQGFQLNTWMGNAPEQFLPDDVQPFVLLEDDKGNPLVAAMLDGDWANAAAAGSTHSDEWHVATGHLKPSIERLHRLTKGDLKAMIEELSSEAGQNEITNLSIGRGTVHFIFGNGEVRSFIKNALEKKFDWGWTSNHYMYSEDAPPVKVEDKNPFTALLGKKALPKSEGIQVEPRKEQVSVRTEKTVIAPAIPHKETKDPMGTPPVVVPDVVPAVTPATPAATPAAVEGKKTFKCDPKYSKPNKIQEQYRKHAGWVPSNYLEKPEVEIKAKGAVPTVIKSTADIGAAIAKIESTATKPVPRVLQDTNSTLEEIGKRLPPVQGKRSVPQIASTEAFKPSGPTLPVPLWDKQTQTALLDTFLKENAPAEAEEIEAKYPSFYEKLGIKQEDTYGWTYARLLNLAKNYKPEAIALLALTQKVELKKMQKDLDALLLAEKKDKVIPKLNLPQRKTG